MKILHIPTGGMFSDGVLNCIIAYMSAMNLADSEVTILATNNPDKSVVDSIKKIGCEVAVIPFRKENTKKYYLELKKHLKKEKYDIVHIHGSSAIMSIELLAAKRAGCKIRIAHSHNTTCENMKADKLLRPLFNKTYTTAFACGKDAGKWMFKERSFTVIPNARDLQKYEYNAEIRAKWRKRLSIPEKSLAIGHIGRFNYQKNHEYLLEVFSEVLKKNPDARLILVGTGENLENVKKVIKEKKIENNVILTGVLENANELLSALDIMLLPSRYEGLPIVVIEWQAAGLPCIVSDTVTDECKICESVHFEPINESPAIWAELILSTKLFNRELSKEEIREKMKSHGYEINSASETLKGLYIKLLNGEKL